MRFLVVALALAVTPACAADNLYPLYAAGRYDDAIRAGTEAGSAEGFAIAARAAMAQAAMQPQPCLSCLQRAEDFARKAVAADSAYPDGHVWLASSLGLEGRIQGMISARPNVAVAKKELEAALRSDPRNAFALAAMGGWNIEIVRGGGALLAGLMYGAHEADGLALFDRAVQTAPGNVAVRYQIGLSLSGYDAQKFRGRISSEFEAAVRNAPQTEYEKFIQTRAAELLALLNQGDAAAFAAKVRQFQGYP
jgi:tetratricopeptide (TPR) repeat protein